MDLNLDHDVETGTKGVTADTQKGWVQGVRKRRQCLSSPSALPKNKDVVPVLEWVTGKTELPVSVPCGCHDQ